jgi:hypothetical protein
MLVNASRNGSIFTDKILPFFFYKQQKIFRSNTMQFALCYKGSVLHVHYYME